VGSRWIVSSRFDLSMVIIPFTIAAVALALLAGLDVEQPLWAYLLCFVAFDVAHVWATVYVTYLDGEAFARRRALFLWPIPVSFAVAFGLYLVAPWLFWTGLAYFAIYHFAKQQYGFIAIYKAKAGERDALDYRLDKLALWTGTIGPVLLWHATPTGQFDWFDGGERFLVRLPEEAKVLIAAGMALVGTVWLLRQLHVTFARGRALNVGKTTWMIASWVSWWIGVRMAEHIFISAAFLNFFHGVPFLMLVWHRTRTRHKDAPTERAPLAARLSRSWLPFYGALFAIALVEEVLWDGVVWKAYLPGVLGVTPPALGAVAMAAWVAALSLPQIVHYFLDAYIWKLDGSNPDLYDTFGLARRAEREPRR
jgi:hypothetical protein